MSAQPMMLDLDLYGDVTPAMVARDGIDTYGACRDKDPELFFPEDDDGKVRWGKDAVRDAKAICAACPQAAREACLEKYLNEPAGIFGGMTERERETYRKTRKQRAYRANKATASAA